MSQVASNEKDRRSEVGRTTVFNDPIHGHIELPKICVDIINTPQFLRLRHIKQLGATYEVFPGASHNRFEHSLGVCHLAGIFGKHLQQQIEEDLRNGTSGLTEENRITEEDVICLQIAGLCHDIGHGPMSHAFETHFIKVLDPSSDWKHEKGSRLMFDYLVKENKLPIKDRPTDMEFVKQLILRDKTKIYDTGRTKEKDFLYEIISNKKNGIDVDKWDYFARDSYHLGFKNNFDHNRLIKFSRVIKVWDDGKESWHICYRDKQVEDIYHMYMSRVILHQRACQHKTVQIIQRMYMETLVKANKHYSITTSDGEKSTISECIKPGKEKAFSQLTDHVFRDIRNSSDEELKDARYILERIDTRKHYKLVSEALPKPKTETDLELFYENVRSEEEKILNEIVKISQKRVEAEQEQVMTEVIEICNRRDETQIPEEIVQSSKDKLTTENLLVDIAIFDYGSKPKGSNPVDKVYFYSKIRQGQKKYTAFRMPREDVSHLLPGVFSEHHVRLYIKKDDEKLLEEARKCFKEWCKDKKIGGKWKFQNL